MPVWSSGAGDVVVGAREEGHIEQRPAKGKGGRRHAGGS